MITLSLKKKFGDRTVLDIENAEFEIGKRYALLGVNGSGKSTFLKILCGIINAGSDAAKQIALLKGDSDMAFMPQNSFGFALSLKRNVLLAAPDLEQLNREKRNYYKLRAAKLIEDMGLSAIARKNAAKLSGGETQRMSLCRILMAKHALLLLDEPTSAMDINAAITAENVMTDYFDEFKPTVFFATHSLKQAARIADEVIFLDAGKIVERGTPQQLFTEPQSPELQNFIKNV